MGWAYSFWVGNFYPEGTKQEEFLLEYSRHFDTVEIDNTFYRIPSASTVERWKTQTPADFLFSAKFPRIITHVKMLRDCERETELFFGRMSKLGSKLGPLLLQFPAAFKLRHVDILSDFLQGLPKKGRFAVEVRNKELLTDRLYSVLSENDVALALVGSPFMPSTDVRAADFVYIRLEGDRRRVKGNLGDVEVDRARDLEKWADNIRTFMAGSREVFGYISKYYSGHPPRDVQQLLDIINVS
jgi:uncharacterized protein YecE (DUF72 family)